jgi:hypothetical protein
MRLEQDQIGDTWLLICLEKAILDCLFTHVAEAPVTFVMYALSSSGCFKVPSEGTTKFGANQAAAPVFLLRLRAEDFLLESPLRSNLYLQEVCALCIAQSSLITYQMLLGLASFSPGWKLNKRLQKWWRKRAVYMRQERMSPFNQSSSMMVHSFVGWNCRPLQCNTFGIK